MKYSQWDIVLVKFPFTLQGGLSRQKLRPALVVSDHQLDRRYDDTILAAITSQLPKEVHEPEIILESTDTTGLVKQSLLRLDFLMTIPESLVYRKIGSLPQTLQAKVKHKTKKIFGLP